jgi:hypothetical protein
VGVVRYKVKAIIFANLNGWAKEIMTGVLTCSYISVDIVHDDSCSTLHMKEHCSAGSPLAYISSAASSALSVTHYNEDIYQGVLLVQLFEVVS